ncbi:MAG: hypothetical protein JXA21_19810 [Anaerolineae bacterium]|nr:hypothetical protein [Anaerolineae bacterium]
MKKHTQWLAGLIIGSIILSALGQNLPIATAQEGVSVVIDGVFTGTLLDGDGSLSDGPGNAAPPTQTFVELKKFDAADCIFYQDDNGNTQADATDHYWLDTECNGSFNPNTDRAILNNPNPGSSGLALDFLQGVTHLAYNDVEFNENNRYDNGEDIYFVDDQHEFQNANERIVYDPLISDNKRVLAHLYWFSDAGATYVHNDFIIDTEAIWLDGNGTASAGKGQQDAIGLPLFSNAVSNTFSMEISGRWFSTEDNIYWLSTGPFSDTWYPSGDALWVDRNGDGVYSSTVDSFIVDTGETSDGVVGRLIGSDGPHPIYNFVYNDENQNNSWNEGEDIYTLDGDENYDRSYFFDRWSWFVDGDGDATSGSGVENLTVLDGNTWFQASDRVFHNDANANHDWDDGEALWIDQDGDGLYNSGVDRLLVSSGTVSPGTAGNLLWVQFVDGDGYDTGSDGREYVPRRGQTPFTLEDNVLWYDANDDNAHFWSQGDGLWLDQDGNDRFNETDLVIVRGAMMHGDLGVRLSPGALHFGYDDGEIAINGRYDPGEDIYAANTFLAYDDFEIAFDGAYDPGEDIYNRSYVEVWVYAEGNNTAAPSGIYQPDLEPGVNDEGLQVHINGARIDNPQNSHDTPMGFKAAAGWGSSRGAVSAQVFPGNAYNRHYEYQFTSPSSDEGHLFSHWQTSWRGPDRSQGFGTPAMERYETILLDEVQRTALPPVTPPVVVNRALLGPILLPAPLATTVTDPYCWSLSISNPSAQAVGAIVLTDTLPSGWNGIATAYAPGTAYEINDGPHGPVVSFPDGLEADATATVAICATGPLAPSEDEVNNSVAGVFDHDANGATPMIAIPTAPEHLTARVPVVREPQAEFFKVATRAEVPADWRVTWRMGAINTGYIALESAALHDNVPDGLRVRTQNGTAASGSDVDLAFGTLTRRQVRIVNLETEVASGIAPSTTLTNTAMFSANFTISQTAQLPYGLSASDDVHVAAPRELMPESPYITLSTTDGLSIPDFVLKALLDTYIPTYHSKLLIFTECYGGDLLDDFAGDANTAVLSASAPGQCPYYASYDEAAAMALLPGAGRTSDAVHQAGVEGKNPKETPQQAGTPVSLAPTGSSNPIENRQVLIYAGKLFGEGIYEERQRGSIVNNFASAANTGVTAVGAAGSGNWNYPGTLEGLRGALAGIQEQMSATGQLILFVTGQGDYHLVERAMEIPPKVTATAALDAPASLINTMRSTGSNDNNSGVTLYTPGVVTFTAGSLAVRGAYSATSFTSFVTHRLDINGDGQYNRVGEGTYLFFFIPEAALIPKSAGQNVTIEVDVENRTLETVSFAYVSLDSGSLSKRLPYSTYLPLICR